MWQKENDNLGKSTSDRSNDGDLDGDAIANVNSADNKITVYIYPNGTEEKELFTTVSNIRNTVVDHEYTGHLLKKWGDSTGTHHKVYEYQMQQPSWKKATIEYRKYINETYKENRLR